MIIYTHLLAAIRHRRDVQVYTSPLGLSGRRPGRSAAAAAGEELRHGRRGPLRRQRTALGGQRRPPGGDRLELLEDACELEADGIYGGSCSMRCCIVYTLYRIY